jgi:hypothetical protein
VLKSAPFAKEVIPMPARAWRVAVLAGFIALTVFFVRVRADAGGPADQQLVARVTTTSQEDVDRLARLGLDLLETREGDDLFILTTPEEVERLCGEGWDVKVDEPQTASLRPATLTFQGGYRTVPEMRARLPRGGGPTRAPYRQSSVSLLVFRVTSSRKLAWIPLHSGGQDVSPADRRTLSQVPTWMQSLRTVRQIARPVFSSLFTAPTQ